ncbi:MAG: alkaline phosphatase family protein [Acidimicrobiia bacterium]|nr:alkaline phosphatase family protein [Acidimicrobiia bacterium]
MHKVVLVICDGLGYGIARDWLGYLEGLVEAGEASLWKGIAQLPTNSRPNYESLLTGLAPARHGIVANEMHGVGSSSPNLFGLAKDGGRTTGAVAYHWFPELYNTGRVFDPLADVECDDDSLPISHGRFYFTDDHPDEHVFATAAHLTAARMPDFLLVHPMGIDHAGHTHGMESDEYRLQVKKQDVILSLTIPMWRALGYRVLVTADHGHGPHRQHGGATDVEREVPIYLVDGSRHAVGDEVSTLRVAPTVLRLLDLAVPDSMEEPPLVGG